MTGKLQQETLGGLPIKRGRPLGRGKNPVCAAIIEYPDGRKGEYALKLNESENDQAFGQDCDLLEHAEIKGALRSHGPYEFVGYDGAKRLGVISPRVLGQNLEGYMRGIGPLSRDDTVAVMAQAARTLHSSHCQGFAHLDIKPSNLMREAATGRVFTIDWEMAQRIDERMTQPIGTLPYMAPEVARRESPAAD